MEVKENLTPVTIDYRDIPIMQIMTIPSMNKKIRGLLQENAEEGHSLKKLIEIPSTLRQLMLLYEGEPLGLDLCESLFELFLKEDIEHPIGIETQYPFLLQPNWKLEMKEISSMKIDIRDKDDSIAVISSIKSCKGTLNHEFACCLQLEEPFKNDLKQSKVACFNRLNEGNEILALFQTKDKLHHFLKKILLNGTVDLGE